MNLDCAGVLKQLVTQNIDLHLYDNAKFFAERLYYEQPSADHLFLLAQCFHFQQKTKQVYHLLQDCNIPPARYLLAITCITLKRFKEAERALLPSPLNPLKLSKEMVQDIPGGAAGLYLLGKICRLENRREAAIKYLNLSLQVYIFLDNFFFFLLFDIVC